MENDTVANISLSHSSPASHARKRTKQQREADLEFIAHLVVRGVTQAQTAEQLATVRPYRISRSQVRDDVALLVERWQAEAVELRSRALVLTLRKLDAIEKEAWQAWDRSKELRDRPTTGRGSVGADPSILSRILDVITKRSKLLGLDAPDRFEVGFAPASPMSDEEQVSLLKRHMERMEQRVERHPLELGRGIMPPSSQ